jgi:phosphoesterase RecJ-like protein
MTLDTVKSLGKVIGTLTTDRRGKVAWLVMNAYLVKKDSSLADQTDDIIRFARSIKGVEVALLFKETKRHKEVRVNFRSRGKVDVNAIAHIFGGGGHKMASGCTVRGTLKDVVHKVVAETVKRCQ